MNLATHRFDGLKGEQFEISLDLDVLASIVAVSSAGTTDNSASIRFTGKWRPDRTSAWFEIAFDIKYVAEDGTSFLQIFADDTLLGKIDLTDDTFSQMPVDDLEELFSEDRAPIASTDILEPFNDKLAEHVDNAITAFDEFPVPPEPVLCLIKAGLASILAQSVKCHNDINPEIALRKKATQFAACIGRNGVSIGIRTAFRTLRCIMALG